MRLAYYAITPPIIVLTGELKHLLRTTKAGQGYGKRYGQARLLRLLASGVNPGAVFRRHALLDNGQFHRYILLLQQNAAVRAAWRCVIFVVMAGTAGTGGVIQGKQAYQQ